MIFWSFNDGYFAAIAAQPETDAPLPPAGLEPTALLDAAGPPLDIDAPVDAGADIAAATVVPLGEALLDAAVVVLDVPQALASSTIPRPTDTLIMAVRFTLAPNLDE